MIDSNVKSLLKKLFAVAENDASTDGEIDNALRAAKVLMAKHQIERDDVFEDEAGNVQTSMVTYGQAHRYTMFTAITGWENLLAHFIVEFIPGIGWYRHRGQVRRNQAGMVVGRKTTKVIFYGPDTDVQFAVEIWDEVNLVIQSAARLRFGNALARGEAAAYSEGFASALYESNKREEQRLLGGAKGGPSATTSDSKTLMVVNRALAIQKGGKEWLRETQGVKLRTGSRVSSAAHHSHNAYNQGKADGAQYRPTDRSSSRRLLS